VKVKSGFAKQITSFALSYFCTFKLSNYNFMKSKILLIVRREYLTRVKKKSFIIMTFLAPVLFAALAVGAILLMTTSSSKDTVAVVDESGIYKDNLENSTKLVFTNVENLDDAREQLKSGTYNLVLHIEKTDSTKANPVALFYNKKQPGMDPISAIQKQLQDILQNKLLMQAYQITTEDYNKIKAIRISISGAIDVRTEQEASTALNTGIGFISGILLFMFVMMFCTQVMQGVIEEKSNRIVEVIVSSVKPFQIMMGKIIGIAAVGLTQFILWIVLTTGIIAVASGALAPTLVQNAETIQTMNMGNMMNPEIAEQMQSANTMDMLSKLMSGVENINFVLIIAMFFIYFLGGYLLYASLFAAVGSAVDNEADTQQFMMPLMTPLMIGYIAALMLVGNPHGVAAFWLSIIPFTSPMVMMMRVGFGVPVWELALSIGLLIAGFIFTTWFAAKIYRVGILMYGKKVDYKELWKWLRY
jgi:ABC-2 type transport system permease protein